MLKTIKRSNKIISHYDMLIDENNDSFRDSPALQEYMNQWDGQVFIDSMKLDCTKKVLEIGVGTGRLAAKVAPQCFELTGIDISPKTICRAKENLVRIQKCAIDLCGFCSVCFRYNF